MPRFVRKALTAMVTVFALSSLCSVVYVVAAQPAFAASSYCRGRGSCSVFAGPNSGYYYAEIPNYTAVRMICWTDTQWYSVNYSSPRWFKVTTPYTSTTWMHSSEVDSQTTVPHC